MSATFVNIINPDGTVIALGGKSEGQDYTKCFIASGEYSDEYQGASEVKLTVHSNRMIPVVLGARIFYDTTDGAGGYILLAPPSIERISSKHFIYEMVFSGNIHLLETKLFFNQDSKGDGWNLSFSLVGTATDFLTLICTNMNRTEPVADPISETWAVGKVDDTTNDLLLTFDNDNCLTALRKVSEAFKLPYRTSLSGSTITLDLTNECRIHDHVYTVGDGLGSFKMAGSSDRPFATALHVLGSTRNIPYDYQGGVKRLRVETGTVPDEQEVIFDDGTVSGNWTASEGNDILGVLVDFASTDFVYHGTTAMKIYPYISGSTITGQIIKIVNGDDPYDASDGTLHLWVYLDLQGSGSYDFAKARLMIVLVTDGTMRNVELSSGMYGFSTENIGKWQEIVIPMKDFGCVSYLIEQVGIIMTGTWGSGANLYVDHVYISISTASRTDGFIYDEEAVARNGRIESVAINEDIYPKSSLTVVSKTTEYKFVSNLDFDLNAKDGGGNTIYRIARVDARLTFNSGNLSGYGFAIKSFTPGTNEIELIPFTEESGQDIPSLTGTSYQFNVGDTYVITEINMPESYVTTAEEDLLEWGQDQYLDYSTLNEIAEVDIDPVWVKQATDQQYTLLGESPVVHYDLDPLVNLFKAGDLITINIAGLFARQLRVVDITHEFYSKNAIWKVTLGNYAPLNLPGRLVSALNDHEGRLITLSRNSKNEKYYMG
ncbi:MAG: hypothetical protein PHD61_05650 [Bacteroidales bacterium]|nr:hypothetical protein [Lentimicrobiaceae bacterium]MDD5694770.1 hypothetical protein [Bacteroidales bacterium]